MRTEHGVQVGRDAGAFILDGQRNRVRVGEQHQALAVAAQGGQEFGHAGEPLHLVHGGAFERTDIEPQLAAPVLHAVPVQRTLALPEPRHQVCARLIEGDAAGLRPGAGNDVPPEPGIKRQVQQRAVKIQQHRIDGGPVRECGSGHCPAEHIANGAGTAPYVKLRPAYGG